MRKKLLIIIPTLNGGGAERVVLTLLKNFDREKFELYLMVINLEGSYINEVPEDVKVIDLGLKRVRYAIIKLMQKINEIEPECILSTLNYLNVILIAIKPFLRKHPKIIVREANTISKELKNFSKMRRIIFKTMYSYFYPRADIVIAQSEGMKSDLINYLKISENKIRLINNPIDVNQVKLKSINENPFDNSLFNIVSCGRLCYQKGFDILISAFKIVTDHYPQTQLTILGEGPLKSELVELSRKNRLDKNIHFVGFKENPYPYYRYSNLFVLSSRWEGFPNVLLEALASGAVVLSTECQSGPKEILGDNEFGYLVPTDNIDKLAEGIMNILSGRSEIILNNTRALKYDVKNIVEQYQSLFFEKF